MENRKDVKIKVIIVEVHKLILSNMSTYSWIFLETMDRCKKRAEILTINFV